MNFLLHKLQTFVNGEWKSVDEGDWKQVYDGDWVPCTSKEVQEDGLWRAIPNALKPWLCLADPNAQRWNVHGATAYHQAVANGDRTCLEVLLAH